MKLKIRRKLQNKKGFTLVEMLACIVTLTIVGGICTTGINFALKCYKESVFESNSQMLDSTIDLYISDILRYATDVETEETTNKVVGFVNPAYQIYGGTIGVSTADTENKGKMVAYTRPSAAEGEVEAPEQKEVLIVGQNMYTDGMKITNFTLTYDETKHCFEGSYQIESTIVSDVVKTSTFTCRTISE